MSTTRHLKPIILYDIPGNVPECKAWSPNTWRVRFALNYKEIPLKTEWVEFPDVEALYQKLNLTVQSYKADGSPYYTVPIIHDPNTGQNLSESLAIAVYLDKTYPDTRPLFPKGTRAFQAVFTEMINRWYFSFTDLTHYAVWTRLSERGKAHYRTTREALLGKKLEELRTETAWKEAERAYEMVDKWLCANLEEGEGRDGLVMGDTICFADITLVSGFVWMRVTLGSESEEWARIMSWKGARAKKTLEKFAQYEIVDL